MDFAIQRCVDQAGRIVLPKDIRNHYGIKAGDVLKFVTTENGILLEITCDKNESGKK